MALFRGIKEYIVLDANNITLVFDSGNIVNISGNIFLYPPHAIQYCIIISMPGFSYYRYIIYKIPIILNGRSQALRNGYAYYYMDASNQRWILSEKEIYSKTQAVSYTLQQIYRRHKSKV